MHKVVRSSVLQVPFAIVSNAHASRDTHRRLGYDGRKIEVIPNGVDTTLFFPSQQLGKAMRKSVGIAEKSTRGVNGFAL